MPPNIDDTDRELALLRFLAALGRALEGVQDAEKGLAVATRLLRDFYDADEVCVAMLPLGAEQAELSMRSPRESAWDRLLLAQFLRGERPRLPSDLLLAPVRRRDRLWALICLRRRSADFGACKVDEIRAIAEEISKAIQRADRLRLADVRLQVDAKLTAQLRPKDLFYQILHSLRSLTGYDHSAAVLIHHEARGVLEVVAEQIAWRKGKGRSVGRILPLSPEARCSLESGEVVGFDRVDGGWREWGGRDRAVLAQLLDYGPIHEEKDGQQPLPERSMLCAPLPTREGALGVLKIAAQHPGTFGPHEADLLRSFLPQAAIAVENLQRAESLELRMLEAEKKNLLANLARGVSHDVHAAIGKLLPLVQQMIAEARTGPVDGEVLVRDLEQIESSIQVCRRIFSGMLAIARGSHGHLAEGHAKRAIDNTLSILDDGMRRQRITLKLDIPDGLPPVRSPQSDLDQLFLNLATNALEAMPTGGELTVAARSDDGGIEFQFGDTGVGIAPEELERVLEPFYTTKRHGSGLGLAICRSIVETHQGRMNLESRPGEGTRVRIRLPSAPARAGEDLARGS